MPRNGIDGPGESLDARRTALFLDVDGTLLDIAPRPGSVAVPSSLIETLANAEKALEGALALVSGRPLEELDRLFAPLTLRASGVHGAQTRLSPEGTHQERLLSEAGLPLRLWMALTELLFEFPGTFAENKRYGFAVHYRTVPMLEERLRAAMTDLVARHADLDLQLLSGHFIFEIKSRRVDKGKAIIRFLQHEPFSGRMPIFIGDDATDEAGFVAVVDHGGRAYSVGAWRPHVSFVFDAPEDVRRWLAQLPNDRAPT